MDTAKVREVIAELRREIEPKMEAIRVLENLLSSKGQTIDQLTFNAAVQAHPFYGGGQGYAASDSYVNLAVALISANESRPMSIKNIVERIRTIKGNPDLERRSIESTLYQHTKSEKARLVKVAPGTYGLKRYPREESAA